MAVDSCVCFKEFLKVQTMELRRAMKDTRWYLSETQGKDVGHMYSRRVFIEQHFEAWAADFRKRYCEHVCTEAGRCEFYVEFCVEQRE